MNPVLVKLAANIQKQFAFFAPQAYQAGKLKAQRQYGIPAQWGDRDNANISILLNRHAEELSRSMARAEEQISQGESLQHTLENFLGRIGAWSWALFPAMALGLNAYVDQHRREIADLLPAPPDATAFPASDIGIVWHTTGDDNVCRNCDYLNGRWFDAREAYDIAARVHPGCRCPPHFDVGTPNEAMVGPISSYQPGTAQDIFRDLNVAGLAQARIRRARQAFVPVPKPKMPVNV